jgi:hypothetical protein
MTAMVTQRSGLDAFRKSWICGDCGGSSSVGSRECEDCGQVRGQSAPRASQSVALSQNGNGSVVNNVLVVGGDMDNGRDYYDVAPQASFEPPQSQVRPQYEPAYTPAARQLTGGEKLLVAGTNVAIWSSVFVLVPAAIFMIWLLAAGLSQIARVVPH